MEAFSPVVVLCVLVAICAGIVSNIVTNRSWEDYTVQRGLATFCPMDGEWAWKGECK